MNTNIKKIVSFGLFLELLSPALPGNAQAQAAPEQTLWGKRLSGKGGKPKPTPTPLPPPRPKGPTKSEDE